MKIAVVTPEYPPDVIGGGGTVVASLVHELGKRHQVRVFSAWDSKRSWTMDRLKSVQDGVEINRYPLVPISRKPYLRSVLPPNPLGLVSLWKDLSSWSPNMGHLHGYGYAIVDFAAFMLKRRRVPYIFTVHGLPLTPYEKGRQARLAYSAYRRIGVGRTIAGARAITAISGSVAKSMGNIMNLQVIPNGLTPLPMSDDRRAESFRNEIGIEAGVPIIAAAGRLSRSKGFDVLLRSLAYVDLPFAACVVAGADGGLLPELRQLEANRPRHVIVRCIGPVDRQGIADLFRLASVVAIPSRDEPFGLVGLEALAAERRVVASNVGGLAEFLAEPFAELVPPGDPAALGIALTKAIRRGSLSLQDAVAATDVVARHRWTDLALKYEHLMESAMDDRHRRDQAECRA